MNLNDSSARVRAPSVHVLAGDDAGLTTIMGALSDGEFRAVTGAILRGGVAGGDVTSDPDVLIIDISLSDSAGGAEAERFIKERFSRGRRIVRAGALSSDAARRLVRLDAVEIVDSAAPLSELVAIVEQVARTAPAKQAGSAIAIFSPRGGVGVTTLAVEAASLLAESEGGRKGSVCLFDLNLNFGAAASMLGLEPALRIGAMDLDESRIDAQLLTAYAALHADGLAVVAAAPNADVVEASRSPALMRLLDVAASRFDSVVLDLPRTLSPEVRGGLSGADVIVLVLDLTVPGLRIGQAAYEGILAAAGAGAKVKVILNRVPRRSGALTVRDAERMLPGVPVSVIHADDEIALEALERGVAITRLRPESRIAREIREAFTGVLPVKTIAATPAPSRSLMNRLVGR